MAPERAQIADVEEAMSRETAPAQAEAPEPGPAQPAEAPPRLARGPFVLGEPSAVIEPQLSGAGLYRPDTVADGGAAFGLTVRAASVRGLLKRYVAGPRQDDLCLRLHPASHTLVAAVADGVSGAGRSDVGAVLAARHATAAVAADLDAGRA